MKHFKIEVVYVSSGRALQTVYAFGKKQMVEAVEEILLEMKNYTPNRVIYCETVDKDWESIKAEEVWQYEKSCKCFRKLNKSEMQDWLDANGQCEKTGGWA